MEYIIIAVGILIIVLEIVITVIAVRNSHRDITKPMTDMADMMISSTNTGIKNLGELISSNQKNSSDMQLKKLDDMVHSMSDNSARMENRFKTYEQMNEQKLEAIRGTVEKKLTDLSDLNAKKLDEMRHTVDEKLQKTLEEKMDRSFKLVSERLEQVYKGLGEMQSLASGVGDLKKVLSNVKTRGILGEIQLGSILKQILSPEQYDENIKPIPGGKEFVEFAIKMPAGEGEFIYLPIDSKFPQDAYSDLVLSYEEGDAEAVKQKKKLLETRIKVFAKDIRDKYIEVPYTTDFAIMFLPFEGLYAEVINSRGLVETLQNEYHVNVAGPSTMAALLNSLQMGFKTLAIEKRSQEVWKILGGVKSEFDKFSDTLDKVQNKITAANKELDNLVGTRTRAIQRQLKGVESFESLENAENEE